MEQCSVYCINTKTDIIADILERTDKRIKVALVETDMTITLSRKVTTQPYIGFLTGLEFETFGDME
jgi:hypothetical protein